MRTHWRRGPRLRTLKAVASSPCQSMPLNRLAHPRLRPCRWPSCALLLALLLPGMPCRATPLLDLRYDPHRDAPAFAASPAPDHARSHRTLTSSATTPLAYGWTLITPRISASRPEGLSDSREAVRLAEQALDEALARRQPTGEGLTEYLPDALRYVPLTIDMGVRYRF